MPFALARGGIQTEHRICEEIVAMPVRPVKIEGRGTRRCEDQSALFIHNQPGPIVRSADVLPGIFRPGLVSELARMRNRMEGPSLPARVRIEGANVTRRRRQTFAQQTA